MINVSRIYSPRRKCFVPHMKGVFIRHSPSSDESWFFKSFAKTLENLGTRRLLGSPGLVLIETSFTPLLLVGGDFESSWLALRGWDAPGPTLGGDHTCYWMCNQGNVSHVDVLLTLYLIFSPVFICKKKKKRTFMPSVVSSWIYLLHVIASEYILQFSFVSLILSLLFYFSLSSKLLRCNSCPCAQCRTKTAFLYLQRLDETIGPFLFICDFETLFPISLSPHQLLGVCSLFRTAKFIRFFFFVLVYQSSGTCFQWTLLGLHMHEALSIVRVSWSLSDCVTCLNALLMYR